MQPEPSLPQEPQAEKPAPQELGVVSSPPPKRSNVAKIIQIALLVLLILGVAGLGYWDYQLNTQLKAAQESLSDLHGQYDELTTQKNSLASELDSTNSELANTKTELDTTNETLSTTKSDISKSNQDINTLKSKMEKAGKYMEIMRGAYEDHDVLLITFIKIAAIKDSKLEELFNAYLKTSSSADFLKWLGYLLTTAKDTLTK